VFELKLKKDNAMMIMETVSFKTARIERIALLV